MCSVASRPTTFKEKVGPDGARFADYETNILLIAHEKDMDVSTRLSSRRVEFGLDNLEGSETVALYFISSGRHETEGQQLEATLTPLLIGALEQHCHDGVPRLIANIGTESERFDLASYFGGGNMPRYCLVYKIFLKGRASVLIFRSQHNFEATAQEHVDIHTCFVLFGVEALIMDVGEDY